MLQPGAYKFEIQNPTRAVPIAGSEPFEPLSEITRLQRNVGAAVLVRRRVSSTSHSVARFSKSIICPKSPPQTVDVVIKCDWPADLEKERPVLYAPFSFRGRTLEPGMRHGLSTINCLKFRGLQAVRSRSCAGQGRREREILHNRGLLVWTFLIKWKCGDISEKAAKLGFRGILETRSDERCEIRARRLGGHFGEGSPRTKGSFSSGELGSGTYGLNELIVMRPNQSPTVEAGRRRFDVLVVEFPGSDAACKWTEIRLQRMNYGSSTQGPREWTTQQRAGAAFTLQSRTSSSTAVYWDNVQDRFEARPARSTSGRFPCRTS